MKIPFLHNVRRGLATNSSSSHSLVFYKKEVATNDLSTADYTQTEFGWNNFRLDTLGEKLMYGLTQAIGDYTWGELPEGAVEKAMAEYGHLFPEFADKPELWENALRGYVDHQSRHGVSEEYVNQLRDPHTVVFGGNDNDDYDPVRGTDIDWYHQPEGLPEGVERIE